MIKTGGAADGNLPAVQGTRVRSLVLEDPTWSWATKPAGHNYWAHVLQRLKSECLEPVLGN